MENSEIPPQALLDLMKDDHELRIFEGFKAMSADGLHPGFRHQALYDDQRAIFKPPSST